MNYCIHCGYGVRLIQRLNRVIHNHTGLSECSWKGHTTATPRWPLVRNQ